MFSPALVHLTKALACATVIVLALAVAESSPAAPLEKTRTGFLSPPSRRGHLRLRRVPCGSRENKCGTGGQRCRL